MERDVLILISTIVWTLENVLPWLLGAFVVMLLIMAVLAIDWIVDRRAYINYEQGTSLPRDAKVMEKMADLLGVSVDFLMDGRDDFILKTEDAYGYRGKMQAKKILDATEQLCAGGSLSPADEEQFQQHMFQIFTRMKERNKIRYAQAHENADKKPE